MKVVTVVGARPQFIKAAPLSREIRKEHQEILLHTGQHYDDVMSDIFFRELGVPTPNYNLGVGSGPHGKQTGEMLRLIEEILLEEAPDRVIVFGDTNSTLAGALAAAKLHIPLAHVEAGLRSYNRAMPEEINRVLTDHVSDLLFCPTPSSVENLRREGVTVGVHYVGDVMYDALRMFRPLALERSTLLKELQLEARDYAVLTLHRAENVDSDARLTQLMDAIRRIEMPVVFPAHPRTRKRLETLGLIGKLGGNIYVLPPVGYLDMVALQAQARVVLTDSGGVQREAHFLSVPSIILRKETEWPELVEAGSSHLEGDDLQELAAEWMRAAKPITPLSLFGAGDAAGKIARQLAAG